MKIILIFFLFLSNINAVSQLKQLYIDSKATVYRSLSYSEFEMATSLFQTLLHGQINSERVMHSLQSLGLMLVHLDKYNTAIIDHKKRGWGFYIIRHDIPAQNLISIPHRYHDIGTGSIGYKLMKNHPYRAIAFNTAHRKISDLAHTKYTIFNAFHRAFSLEYKEEFIYQLHGFSKIKHGASDPENVNAIISSTTFPTQQVEKIAQCISSLGYEARVFGKDVFELGGTTNHQSKMLKENGYLNFIHIELNKLLRDNLRSDKILHNKIQRCLP